MVTVGGQYTVESLLTDIPNKGHCIKYLSTMDTTKSPNFNPPINIMRLESLKRGQSLYSGPLEFILVPKCPLFGDSTVGSIYGIDDVIGAVYNLAKFW